MNASSVALSSHLVRFTISGAHHLFGRLNLSPSFTVTRKAFPAAKCSAVYNNVQLLFVLPLNRAYSQLNNKYLAYLYTHIQNSETH